jgi:predicted MFS family arabinose efflux permease
MSTPHRQPDARLILWGGMTTMMLAMGIGRFIYTPILPDMIAAHLLDVRSAGLLAATNFIGYFVGALVATLFGRASTRRRLLMLGIVLSVLTTLGMGLAQDLLAWHALRFLSGIASAFAQIFISAFVMEALVNQGRADRIGWLLGGVGIGIVTSSLAIELAQRMGVSWAGQWLVAGGLATLFAMPALYTGFRLRPVDEPPRTGPAGAPRRKLFSLVFTLLFLAYGGMGFGYVVQATYLPTLVRSLPQLAGFSTLTWLVVGLAAAPSNFIWQAMARRLGVTLALIMAFLLQGGGLLVPVLWHSVPGAIIGAAALGATLIGITALCLQQARILAPEQFPRALAWMTVVFSLGQIGGPPLAALLVGPGNDFLPPTIMTSAVLAVSALLCLPLLGRRGQAAA